jgi:DNA polymerase-3 subunit alpha
MGFVTLEDIQGNIELVLFPRTWERVRETLVEDSIIVVVGKVDTSGTPPKVLVDSIRTDLEKVEAEAATGQLAAPGMAVKGGKPNVNWKARPAATRETQPAAPAKDAPKPGSNGAPASQSAPEAQQSVQADRMDEIIPPPPENFPADWEAEWQPGFEHMAMASQAEPVMQKEPIAESLSPASTMIDAEMLTSDAVTEIAPVKNAPPVAVASPPAQVVTEAPRRRLPSLYAPQAAAKGEDEQPPKQITVRLRSTGDKERDRRRIKTIYGTLISFHGRDRFSFHIFEDGRGVLMDFPGETTRVCSEMLERLQKVTGEESWSVDEITFL